MGIEAIVDNWSLALAAHLGAAKPAEGLTLRYDHLKV